MIDQIQREVSAASELSPYTGFEQAYVCLAKLSLDEPETEEFARIMGMTSRLPLFAISRILKLRQLDDLLGVEPPLETILAHEREELRSIETAEAIATVRRERELKPKKAIRSLLFILKNIRNKRDHGFKSPDGPRDHQILSAAQPIVVAIAEACIASQPQAREAK